MGDRQHVLWERYIEEMVVAPEANRPTIQAWAEANGTTDRTVRRWRTNERFNDMLNKRLAENTFTPEKRFQVIDNLLEIASTGHDAQSVSAAKQAIEMMDRHLPPPSVTDAPPEFAELSTAELMEIVQSIDGDSQ